MFQILLSGSTILRFTAGSLVGLKTLDSGPQLLVKVPYMDINLNIVIFYILNIYYDVYITNREKT